jgi:hypothetical protein
MILEDSQHNTQQGGEPNMSTSNPPSKSPTIKKQRPGVIIAMVPIGAILGFLGGLLIEIIVDSSRGQSSALIIRRPSRGTSSAHCPVSAH